MARELGLRLAHAHLGAPRELDLARIAPDVATVGVQDVALVRPLVRLAAEVRLVGEARDDTQRQLLTPTADPDRRTRLLQRLRVTLRAGAPCSSDPRSGCRARATSR